MTARTSIALVLLLALAAPSHGQSGELRPVPEGTSLRHVARLLDTSTGRLRPAPAALGAVASRPIYDNTCFSGFYLGLDPAGPGGTGSAHPETFGTFGAVPSTRFGGDAGCTAGTCDAYDVRQFTISYCTLNTSATAIVEFWDASHRDCPTCSPLGDVRPPRVPPVFSTTLTGLPASATAGVLECYVLNVSLDGPGFVLTGSDELDLAAGADLFAWAFTMPSSTGADGPLLAGDTTPFTSPCVPCQGTLFEVGGPTDVGTGAGTDSNIFWEDFGGTSVPGGSGECYFFGSSVPAGGYLELFAEAACATPRATFCDGTDGALASCPCANPGRGLTGCDSAFPTSSIATTTGGVHLSLVDQQTTPQNRAEVVATGLPGTVVGPNPAPRGVLLRSSSLAPPAAFGDGVLCLAGLPARLGGTIGIDCVARHTFDHGTFAGAGTFYYQLWYRSNPAAYCGPTASNTTNGIALTW